MVIVGIDYGSRLAGTTAIAWFAGNTLQIIQSEKGQDADQMILEFLGDFSTPLSVYIDAPLSLPGVYTQIPDFQDYFYRLADRELNAMSPMFLGGLTARAMRLKANMEPSAQFFEAYPSALATVLGLKSIGYKKEISHLQSILDAIAPQFCSDIPPVNSWHQVDALLALLTGLRHRQGLAQIVGNPAEGLIHL